MSKDYCINDQARECSVVLEYDNGFVIERARKRGKADVLKTYQRREDQELEYLAENEKGELSQTQKVINDILGIDYETFTKSVVLGQNIVNNFVSGNKDQRRSIIEETLGLDKFNAYFETAKNARNALETRLNELNKTRTALLQELKSLSAAIQSTTEKINAKTADRQAIEQDKTTAVEGREDARIDLERQIAELKLQQSAIEVQQAQQTQQPRDTPSALIGRSVNEWKQLRDELVVRLNHMHEYSLDEKNCPRCGRPIDESHHAKLLEENHAFLTRVNGARDTTHTSADLFKELQQLRGEIDRDIEALERTEVQGMKRRLELSERIKGVERAVADKEHELLRYQNQLVMETSDLDRRLHYLAAEIDQLTATKAQHETRVGQLNEEVTAVTTEHSHVSEQYSMTRFWEVAFDKNTKSTMGFETVRSYIFADLVQELNLVLDSYADQLSDGGKVSVTLTPELELEEVYVKRSGGERKRTDLAVLFSLFELVRNRSRYQPQYLMLDEVFDALDRTGQLQVQQVLASLATRLRKVFVITHVSELSRGISIAGTINVQMKRAKEEILGSELTVNTV
jgi:DNA repair exonuclease SbcCD ATPase subunit